VQNRVAHGDQTLRIAGRRGLPRDLRFQVGALGFQLAAQHNPLRLALA